MHTDYTDRGVHPGDPATPLRGRHLGHRSFLGSPLITWLLTLALCGCWGFWVYKIIPMMERVAAAAPVPACDCPVCPLCQCPTCEPREAVAQCPPCQCTCNCGGR